MKKELLRINRLNYNYTRTRKLENVSFCILEGECIGFLGLSYSGKDLMTSLLRGELTEGDGSGAIYLGGQKVNDWEVLGKEIYYMCPDNYVIEDWTVAEYLCLVDSGWAGSFWRKGVLNEEAGKYFEELELDFDISSRIRDLSELDHGASIESCRHAVDMGFTSVMYDASAKPFEDNVAETRSVVEYAHERGASVEAELGHILTSKAGAAEGNGKSYTREEAYTDPEMAKEFIERTNVDALAIGFGTAHGIYMEKPVLDLNRIALIKSAKDIPYVMHGGSGLSEEEYRTAIHNGIRKINYYTYLSLAGGRGVMQYLEDKKDKDAIYFEDIAKAGITAMKADVKRAMKIFESDGKI